MPFFSFSASGLFRFFPTSSKTQRELSRVTHRCDYAQRTSTVIAPSPSRESGQRQIFFFSILAPLDLDHLVFFLSRRHVPKTRSAFFSRNEADHPFSASFLPFSTRVDFVFFTLSNSTNSPKYSGKALRPAQWSREEFF